MVDILDMEMQHSEARYEITTILVEQLHANPVRNLNNIILTFTLKL